MLNEYASRIEVFRSGRRTATIDIYDTVKKGRFLDVRGKLETLEKKMIEDIWSRCTAKNCV
jgi:hypothetical protein